MEKFVKEAAHAWAKSTLNIQRFADAYVAAVETFGERAKKRFCVEYPMFGPREWKRFELVGRRELLPQFIFKSDAFVGKLLKFRNSTECQKALVGASKNGFVRVDRGNGPEKVALSSLTKSEEKALTLLLSEEDSNLSHKDLLAKYRSMVVRVNKRNESRALPNWSVEGCGEKAVVRFNRSCRIGRAEANEILKHLYPQHAASYDARRAYDQLCEISEAVVALESLRDDEWEFTENHGHDWAFWTEKEDREHGEILEGIQTARMRVQNLLRKATGNEKLEV